MVAFFSTFMAYSLPESCPLTLRTKNTFPYAVQKEWDLSGLKWKTGDRSIEAGPPGTHLLSPEPSSARNSQCLHVPHDPSGLLERETKKSLIWQNTAYICCILDKFMHTKQDIQIKDSGHPEDDTFPITACLDVFYSSYTTAIVHTCIKSLAYYFNPISWPL